MEVSGENCSYPMYMTLDEGATNCTFFPHLLEIDHVPEIDFSKSGFNTRDILTLVVSSDVVNGRSLLELKLANNTKECNIWSRSVVNCVEKYTFSKAFKDVVQYCLRNSTPDTESDPGHKQYRGHISLRYEEIVLGFNTRYVVRHVHDEMQFIVRFPLKVFDPLSSSISYVISLMAHHYTG